MSHYQANIPAPFNLLSDDQSSMQENFEIINEQFGLNHYPFNDANAGKHKFSLYVEQETLPNTENDEIAVFNQVNEEPRNHLLLRYQNNGETFSFIPYMQAFIRLTSDTSNPIEVIGKSVNLDLNCSGWNGRNIILYFQFPTPNFNYFVDITRASLVQSNVIFQAKNKTTRYFEIDTTLGVSAGDELYVRVY
ncbi:MAG: hypothetical protein PVI43_00870 [Candidatus Bathyarchaeota archaeon]|jgi:hypothetical protein